MTPWCFHAALLRTSIIYVHFVDREWKHGKIDTNMCYCFLIPIQDCFSASFTSEHTLFKAQLACDIICSICNFYTCYLCLKYVYINSTCRNRGLGGHTKCCSSCWAHRTDGAPEPAAPALLLAPAVKLLLAGAWGLIQIKVVLISKAERLISRVGALDLLRKGH